MMATLVIETVGTQEYVLEPADFRQRFGAAYGDEAAADLAGVLV
jgi:adenosine kinase